MDAKEFGSDIETAVKFITAHFSGRGPSDMPVLPHSFRVGMRLFEDKYPLNVVLAGFLHDAVEGTDAKADDIARLFGSEVAGLITGSRSEAAAIVKAAHFLDICGQKNAENNADAKKWVESLPKSHKDKIFSDLRSAVC